MMMISRRLFFFFYYINLLSLFCVVSTTISTQSSDTKSTKTTWYEIQPELTQYDDIISVEKAIQSHQQQRRRQRKLIWYGRYDEEMTWRPPTTTIEVSSSSSQIKHTQKSSSVVDITPSSPHPLRTDLWKLNINWKEKEGRKGRRRRRKGGSSSSSSSTTTTTTIEFHRNGYCRIPTLGFVGEWEIFPWGIRCSLFDTNENENENNETTEEGERRSCCSNEYVLYATLHLNPFGDQPKMIHGTIIKSNNRPNQMIIDPIQDHYFVKQPPKLSKWFRKVVATFDGVGVGIDTADFSYSHRRSINVAS